MGDYVHSPLSPAVIDLHSRPRFDRVENLLEVRILEAQNPVLRLRLQHEPVRVGRPKSPPGNSRPSGGTR